MIARGDIWDTDLGPVTRPVVVVTRSTALPVLARVVCVPVTRTIRGHVAEIELGREHGLDGPSAANCDALVTVPKERLARRRGELDPVTLRRLDAALAIALGLDELRDH